MTADITIPPEAAKALAVAIYEITGEGIDMDEARAACLALLKAWPGAKDSGLVIGKHSTRIYILPLPKENTNAEG